MQLNPINQVHMPNTPKISKVVIKCYIPLKYCAVEDCFVDFFLLIKLLVLGGTLLKNVGAVQLPEKSYISKRLHFHPKIMKFYSFQQDLSVHIANAQKFIFLVVVICCVML